MATGLEDLRIFRAAEDVADGFWQHVVKWEQFERDTVGKQLARAADSIGANIAEAFGRFHYGEKLQFAYYARGSLFESKYWLNRTRERHLMPETEMQEYVSQLTDLARQLNAFANSLKSQRRGDKNRVKAVHESGSDYKVDTAEDIIDEADLRWLQSVEPASEISNR